TLELQWGGSGLLKACHQGRACSHLLSSGAGVDLQLMGPPSIRGSWGPLCPCSNSKKPMKKVPGASHGAPY
ncbi:unnamed protein product, partial [Staurois parvus]